MIKSIILILFLLGAPSYSVAETAEMEKLVKITEEYARCADVALGNFASDAESQKAIRAFFQAMFHNVKKMITIESKNKSEKAAFFEEIMGEEALAGFLLRGIAEVSENHKEQKRALTEKLNFDWRAAHKQLWDTHGCNAIYVSLPN